MTRAGSKARPWRRLRAAAGVLAAALMVVGLASCGNGSASGGASESGGDGEPVTLLLDVSPYGKHAPFYVAQEKGYWSDQGLNVEIQSAEGSGDAVTKLASGSADFALADISAAILARGNSEAETKLVAMYHYENLMSVLTVEGNGIDEPADIVGKNLHTIPGEGTQLMLPAFAAANNFDESQVDTTTGQITNLVQAVVSGQVDGALTYRTIYPALEAAATEAGMESSYVSYSDNGVDVYNNGIAVTDSFEEANPEVVEAFVAGFVEGVLDTVEDPDGATDIFTNAVPGTSQDIARAELDVAIEHLNVPEVLEVGFGPMDPEKVQYTLEMVNEYFTVDEPVTDPSVIYTNEYAEEGQIPNL